MNDQFRNKVCLIENEEQLQKVKDIIERNGQKCAESDCFSLNTELGYIFLFFDNEETSWWIGKKLENETEITLSEFEELFNEK